MRFLQAQNSITMSEIYLGVKFKSEQNKKSCDSNPLLLELTGCCNRFAKRGYTPQYEGGSSGNLSVRNSEHPTQFFITASYTDLSSTLTESDFCEITNIDFENFTLAYNGCRPPSSESMMHGAIYANFPQINAILHGHSQSILDTADSLHIPQTREEAPYGTIKIVEMLREIWHLGNFLILKNHGFIALGASIAEAENLTNHYANSVKNE